MGKSASVDAEKSMLSKLKQGKQHRLYTLKYLKRESCYNKTQDSHRLEKYLNLEGFLEKSLKIKSALKSAEKSPKSLEKSLNSTHFCRT